MKKSEIIRRATPEEETTILAREEQRKFFYAMSMMLLQKEIGLSYKEARAFLVDTWETPSRMARDLGIDIHSVFDLQRIANKKIDESGKVYEDIVGEYALPWTVILE